MLSPCLAPSSLHNIFAFGLTWGYHPIAAPTVNKDCLLCSPFPRWTEVRAAVPGHRLWKPLSSSPFSCAFSLQRKIFLGVNSMGSKALKPAGSVPTPSPYFRNPIIDMGRGSYFRLLRPGLNPLLELCHFLLDLSSSLVRPLLPDMGHTRTFWEKKQ